MLNQPAGHDHILRSVQQDAVRVAAVPSGPPGLLIIGLQAFGHVAVNDIGHIGLVDANAERVRRHHDPLPVKQEILLVSPPFLRVQPGMIPGY